MTAAFTEARRAAATSTGDCGVINDCGAVGGGVPLAPDATAVSTIDVDYSQVSCDVSIETRGRRDTCQNGRAVNLAELLTLIEKHAPGLRAAGVLSFPIPTGGIVTLAPADPVQPAVGADAAPEPTDPLKNPALYPGGVVPGYHLEPEDA
jgi:hypothetical protein